MSVGSQSTTANKKDLVKKRNNSGTFNVENPKKMKKAAINSVKEEKVMKRKKKDLSLIPENVEGMELNGVKDKKQKRRLDSEVSEGSPPKKKKFTPKGQLKSKPKGGLGSHSKNSKQANSTSEKPDWSKFKEEKKALREKRRAAQKDADSYDVSIEAKKILEGIRSRKCPAAEQIKQLEKLHTLLKGKLLSVVYAHDMSRVVETMLRLAHSHKKVEILKSMIQELIPEVLLMSKRKYAIYVVRAMIAHSLPSERTAIVKQFAGHVTKILGHKIANVALADLHSKIKTEDQYTLQKELYGNAYKLITSEPVSGLEVIFKILPNMKESTLTNTKEILMSLFEKNIVESPIVHAVLLDYLGFAKPEDQAEMLEQAKNHIKALTQSKDGVHIAMMCIWLSGPKARKKMVKDLKEGFVSLACGEHTHMLLLAIFDSLDDTVLVQKAVLTELLAGDLAPLLNNTYGRKVLMYLCSRRDPKLFTPPVVATLSQGDNNQFSKKDANVRAEELQKFAVPFLLEHIAQNTSIWMDNNSNLLVLLAAVKVGTGDKLQSALKAIAKYTTNPPKSTHIGIDLSIADNSGCHMILKKLAQHDKVFSEKGLATFGQALATQLTDNHYLAWLKNNHCCHLLLEILKNGTKETIETVRSKIEELSAAAWKRKEEIPAGGLKIQEVL
ncbi:Pumilio-like protein 3 [Frankliniella fusca]|uniref:Pumilio-like protein 3 n=1 Tax=Frankliniella fusca TaxID=407009 RepID=A0AAE1H9I8_9NEOP|nr:Pumilio-like protein 3 [Frankliniella fusca]